MTPDSPRWCAARQATDQGDGTAVGLWREVLDAIADMDRV